MKLIQITQLIEMQKLMGDTLLMGIDFGTGGCKITVINKDGEIMADASREYPTHHPRASYCEQYPEDWMTALVNCLQKIQSSSALDMKNIKAIALDASTHNAVLLDRQMKVIRPTIMWTDQRSNAEVEYLEKGWGELIFQIAYQKVAPTWTLPQMLWIRNNEPENYAKIHRVMFVKDYVRYLLTGSWETDFIDAQGSMFFDVKNNCWSEELCHLIDLPLATLPPICSPADLVGKITAEAARITGLSEGTSVICGTSDSCIEDYGAGAIRPGQCILKIATAGNVNVMTKGPNPGSHTLTYSHVVPGICYTVAATNSAAYSLRWFRDNFCFEEIQKSKVTGISAYQYIEELVRLIPAGSEGLIFHPYLLGERAPYWDSSLRASFTGASMSHQKGHFARAVMEGVAFSLKDCLRLIEEMNLEVTEFIIIGGGAKSETWSQILCDVFGKKVIKPSVTDASFSSAMLAGVGVGVFTDLFDAVDKCVRVEKVFEPNLINHEKYNKLFKVYLEVHENLKNIYRNINQILS